MELWFTERHLDQVGHSIKVKETLFSGQSEFQKVDIVDSEYYGRVLLLDGLFMTTERDEFTYHEMIAHIPMLAHPNPKQVLVIGGGDGGTVREVLRHPAVERVVLCEIDGMVIDASRKFLPTIAGALDDPRVDIQVGDGAAYVANSKNEFDVILVDSTDPIGPGEGLFNHEFYTNVFNALKENGIMTAQSESLWAQQDAVVKINKLLRGVFPVVKPYTAMVPTYPGGQWSWTFCSKGIEASAGFDNKFAAELEKTSKYFNREIHRAVFALPNYAKELVQEKVGV